ncbi:MAG: hypothetical protein F6J93_27985 [Oscillatoria sp. SIO1A7]|nr:hypothetical protein [Oscillatoria sp. SIO1A7]
MARYTGLFVIAVNIDNLRPLLIDLLNDCRLEITYDAGDYMMAREVPGEVPFTKLVNVEVALDISDEERARMNFVVKNEELPLQKDNHCRQMFELLREEIAQTRQWQLLEIAAS